MNKRFFIIICMFLLFTLNTGNIIYGYSAGSRASYTKGGWVGAKYVALGKAAEAIVNDVYAIYWNPAGLSELKDKNVLTDKEIKDKARAGNIDEISEKDLLNFSEDKFERSVFQMGVSAAVLDADRQAGFAGFAFDIFNGVLGIGLYSIISMGIEQYDDSGNYINDNLNYTGSVSYISYGWSAGISSIGVSLKVLYENIGGTKYTGAGADFGAQFYLLPFFKVGVLIQDIGTGLYPVDKKDEIDNKYDFSSPSLNFGASLTSEAGVTFTFTAVKPLERDDYFINLGLMYDLMKAVVVYIGMNDSSFSTGTTVKIFNTNISYAFTIDKIDFGYNNIVSISMLF